MRAPIPHLRRGALARVDPVIGLVPSSLTVFQYNPAELSRTLAPRERGGAGSWFGAAPEETFSMRVELDAADQMEAGERLLHPGVYPALSALEMLVHPSVTDILLTSFLTRTGVVEVYPPEAPVAVLMWGTRVVPVRVTQLGVRETAFDSHLNPIRAEVDLNLRVLSADELGFKHFGAYLYLGNTLRREILSRAHGVRSAPTADFSL